MFCIATLSLLNGPAQAQTNLCQPYEKAVRVSFDTRLIPATYNHTLSIKDVRELYTVRGQRVSRAHSNAIGITYAEISLSLSASTRSLPREQGGYCVYLDEVKADFGFEKFDVYIGREYQRGSCEYRTILDHENEHVAINNATVQGIRATDTTLHRTTAKLHAAALCTDGEYGLTPGHPRTSTAH